MKRLAIITTHPIQYYAPWFALLANKPDIDVKVFYTWSQSKLDYYDPDFKQKIKWDIPLLEGYSYSFIRNTSKKPGANHFMGIKCPTLISEIKKWQATHVLVFGWNYHAHLKALRYFKGKIPVWFRGDSTLLDYDIKTVQDIIKDKKTKSQISNLKSYIKFKIRKVFLTYIYKHIDLAFYVGKNNKDYYLAHGVSPIQLRHAPHAIDNNRFKDSDANTFALEAQTWRKKLKLKTTDFTIVFSGKFESKKNPLLLLKAVQNINARAGIQAIKLILIGNGILEKELKQLAADDKNIIFLPFQNQSQMPVIYRLGDMYCLPSKGPGETWGLAVNEAMACGKPVVVSNKVGCAKDLINEDTGYLFESDRLSDLMEIIVSIQQHINEFSSTKIVQFVSDWSFKNITKTINAAINE
ncbi:glycosyltransferase family 4 protein [Carboxylicivirga linearis]|uniref:Glycosyltransferase family 4 protein n=1 Tax=Carboxylicivirga linearis TaxID=1628157 RepID=A0ABS5JUH0_9BACT|nr:glycosyltransferase family 4 protein [Carboxylicivirga linearis]MBS2098537.1 glycosyltransferase family 4 protein [Carboxylicivirga linearis]